MRTLREMDIASVAVYSTSDRAALHVRKADEAAPIDSYLNIESVIAAAKLHHADAIHPGYGFLSENPEFAAGCEDSGIVFIGPSAQSIRLMGSKTEARKIAAEAGAPIVPGTHEGLTDPSEALTFARQCGYPVMLKAVAGGGGKGMRRVDREQDLEPSFREASSEAERAFRDPSVYIEKLIENPRHIEIQLLGDRHGHMIHLGERECSIQRRHQKVIEECPSPLVALHPEMREAMGQAAIRAAGAAGYYNAGTVEFLVDRDRKFYFLEMNTRLQVEHPVTERVTGLDLVRLQIEIAAGARLALRQEDIQWRGAAIECRVYAEDPDNHFFPSPGKITQLAEPAGPGIRLDSGVYPGWTVPLDYDPLLAKLAVWAGTREHATARMLRALGEYHVAGIETNLRLFREILEDSDFREGRLNTGFLDAFFARRSGPGEPDAMLAIVAATAAQASAPALSDPQVTRSTKWLNAGRGDLLR